MKTKPNALNIKAAKKTVSSYLLESRENNDSTIASISATLKHFIKPYLQQQKLLKKSSPHINVFDILEFTNNEMHHSRFLAWLFRYNGTHGQQDLFLKIFFENIDPLNFARMKEDYFKDYIVETEAADENSRIDIRIWKRGAFLVNIENKINALEGVRQTYWENIDAKKRAYYYGISDNIFNYFLTNGGKGPSHKSFKHIYWSQIRDCLSLYYNNIDTSNYNLRTIISQYIISIHQNILANMGGKEDELREA